MTWAVCDVETTIRTSYKRKGNPFDPENWIVMAGWCTKAQPKPQGARLSRVSKHGWFIDLLQGNTILVGQNIKFDLLHILKDPEAYAAWQDWVVAGGILWDTQLVEYLLEGQAQHSHMLSLDDLCLRYDLDLKVDEVKKLWEAGVNTDEIDPDLLSRYLLGEDLTDPMTKEPTGRRREGDIGNTRDVFLKQLAKARASGQSRSIILNGGALIASIEMERNGMYVNKPKGLAIAEDLRVKLSAAKHELEQYLPADLPFKFNWTNRYHLSPLIFGGQVKYERRQYDLKDGTQTWTVPEHGDSAYVYSQKDEVHYLFADGSGTISVDEYKRQHEDSTLSHILRDEHLEKFKGGKNAGEFKTKKVKVDDYTKPKSRMADCYFQFSGFTAPDPAWASDTPGLYSVAADIIEDLTTRPTAPPFLKLLGKVTAMNKDLTTYFISTDEDGNSKGMLTLVQEDSIIHHSINHTSTVTGRFSSSNPNLQNIPKGNKSDVKQVFESRWGEDGCIEQSDFSSLEVYVQAILTGCANLIADLRSGLDMHVVRLAAKEKMDYAEVYALCKGDKYSKEWDYKRTGAKVFSFQRAYGAGNKKIAESTGMPIEEVEALAKAEDNRYPEIAKYFEKRAEEINRNRTPTTTRVPHPVNPAIICQLGVGRVSTPDGKLYTYRESPSPEYLLKRGTIQSFTPTEIKNYEVQGEGGEWMKAAMWLMVREFYRRRNFNNLAYLVNTVHDAAYADVHNSVRYEAATVLHACMEAASDFMEWYFEWPLPLPVPSDTVWGNNMGEENKFAGEEWRTHTSAIRAALRQQYMNGYTPSYLKGNA